jgi:hypothetical protein
MVQNISNFQQTVLYLIVFSQGLRPSLIPNNERKLSHCIRQKIIEFWRIISWVCLKDLSYDIPTINLLPASAPEVQF